LAGKTRERSIWLALGILERECQRLYDSAVLFTPDGEIGLKYRRITPEWHGRTADSRIYGQRTDISNVKTLLGAFAFLICGDLFDDELIQRVRDYTAIGYFFHSPDILTMGRATKNGGIERRNQCMCNGRSLPEVRDL